MQDKLELLIEPVYDEDTGIIKDARLIIFEVDDTDCRSIRDIGEHPISTAIDETYMNSTLKAARFFTQMEICVNGLNLPVLIHENHKDVDLGKAQTLHTKLLKILRSIPIHNSEYEALKEIQDEVAQERHDAFAIMDLCDRFQRGEVSIEEFVPHIPTIRNLLNIKGI